MARKRPNSGFVAPLDDESSTVRPRDAADGVRPRQDSGAGVSSESAAPRSHSSTRPSMGSLADRLEQKVRLAAVLVQNLPSTDTRVRLLNIAIMRRDESLLDGVLSELNKPTTRS